MGRHDPRQGLHLVSRDVQEVENVQEVRDAWEVKRPGARSHHGVCLYQPRSERPEAGGSRTAEPGAHQRTALAITRRTFGS